MLEFAALCVLCLLVGMQLGLTIFFWWERENGPTPLSSTEYHFFRYDDLGTFMDILNENDANLRKELFEEFRKLKADQRKQFDANSKSDNDEE